MIVERLSTGGPGEWAGEQIHVLAIEINRGVVEFRLNHGEHPGLRLYPSSHYKVVNGEMPSHWVFSQNDNRIRIGPSRWYQKGFLERFADQEEDTLLVVKEDIERSIIRGSE